MYLFKKGYKGLQNTWQFVPILPQEVTDIFFVQFRSANIVCAWKLYSASEDPYFLFKIA